MANQAMMPKDEPPPSVRDAIERLVSRHHTIDDTLSALESRLDPILRPGSPTAGSNLAGLTTVSSGSEVQERVNASCDVAERFAMRLGALLARLDV